MTENEAIKELHKIRLNGGIISQNKAKALYVAIQALEKQIPQSPTYEGDGYADGVLVYDTWICPCCDHHYEVDYDDYDYCPNCGQRIDWSNKNE